MTTALASSRSVVLGGFALTGTDDAGVQWMVTDLTGWRGSPATTVQVTQRPADHGGWPTATPKLTPRQMEITVGVFAPGGAEMTAAYERLVTAVSTGPVLLEVTEDGTTRQAVAYRNGDVLPTGDGGAWSTYSVPLIAPDPRRYGPLSQVALYLPASSGGLSWPVSWPVSWPATVVTGDAALPGGGTVDSPLTVTVYGPTSGGTPLTSPLVAVTLPDGTVQTLLYTDSVGVNDFLAIDCEAKSVLYNGTSTRRGLLQVIGGWPSIPPGGAQMSFRAGTYDTTSQVQVSYRPAWM